MAPIWKWCFTRSATEYKNLVSEVKIQVIFFIRKLIFNNTSQTSKDWPAVCWEVVHQWYTQPSASIISTYLKKIFFLDNCLTAEFPGNYITHDSADNLHQSENINKQKEPKEHFRTHQFLWSAVNYVVFLHSQNKYMCVHLYMHIFK